MVELDSSPALSASGSVHSNTKLLSRLLYTPSPARLVPACFLQPLRSSTVPPVHGVHP